MKPVFVGYPIIPNIASGLPDEPTLRACVTYALYNGDVPAQFTELVFLEDEGGLDVNINSTLIKFSAPNLLGVTGDNYVSVIGDALQSVSFQRLQDASDIVVKNSDFLVDVQFPELSSVSGTLQIVNAPALIKLRLPKLQTCPSINLSGLALGVTHVNQILSDLVSSGWGAGSTLNIQGGTSSGPSGQGIVDVATLEGRGATVTTN